VFAALLLSLVVMGDVDAVRVHPLGDLHGDETLLGDDERWLALILAADGARMQSVRVGVEAVEDPLLDAAGERTGRRVSVPGSSDEVLLLLAGGRLRAGPVVLATHASGIDLQREPLSIDLPGQPSAQLASRCDPVTEPAPRCVLWLEQAGLRQKLVHYDALPGSDGVLQAGDDAPTAVLFAGDLDGDGRLDLIIDTSEHYNVAQPTLFLSGAAATGELLRAVGRHRRTGC
jgi:hypothetical protein